MKYGFEEYRPSKILKDHLNLGSCGVGVTSLYFTRNGKPRIDVCGEYHFVRDSRENWRRELAKMKAGGISIVSTYLFWIYHEEDEGVFDFTLDRDVRAFVVAAKETGLDVFLRIGPWCHGECRNGGFPDWLLKKPFALRDNNEGYLALVKRWFGAIYDQVKGLFYKDGGNIIGIQVENELTDNAAHLLELKNIARNVGLDAPLYTVTGWNSERGAEIPTDEVVPVFGAYPEAPWEQHTKPLPISPHYEFNKMRNDSAIGKDVIKSENGAWQLPYENYPFATCELGGGIQVTHHRRPIISGMDIYALSLVKLGSGNNLPGYYMYKGGTNKIGAHSTLNETRATGYPNDYPILSYDFQAPISDYGEIREQYRLLNMLHMFVSDFGGMLAPMEAVMGEDREQGAKKLYRAMRTDGRGGFVFVNHYQRLSELDDVTGAVIDTGSVCFPPIDVIGGVSFFMPFNIELSGHLLEYATAQPLCRVGDTYFFVEINGVKASYKFYDNSPIEADAGSAFDLDSIKIVTLSFDEARYVRKLSGKLYVGEGCDIYELDKRICCAEPGSFSYSVWNGAAFEKHFETREFSGASVEFETVGAPFEPKYIGELSLGGERKLTWRKITAHGDGIVDIDFEYDAAQIYSNGELVADNFYYGRPWRVPTSILSHGECYLVTSEMKDDFYREF